MKFKLSKTFTINEVLPLFVLCFIAITYTVILTLYRGTPFFISEYNYYTNLTDAFFNGRLYLTSNPFDLSFFNGKWYLYLGPSPVLFVLPFYLLWGTQASDGFYTLIAGIINIFLFWLTLREFVKHFQIKLSLASIILLILAFAFVSPHFLVASFGKAYFSYHVIATLYLLLFLYCYFRYLNMGLQSINYYLATVIFFNLAWLARFSLFFYVILFGYLFYLQYQKSHHHYSRKLLLIFGITTSSAILFQLTYNYLRFLNPLESGLRYVVGPEFTYVPFITGKLFSVDYIWKNTYYYFLHHVYPAFSYPYFRNITVDGNSIFSVYPVTLLIVGLFHRRILFHKKYSFFILSSAIVFICSTGMLLLFCLTGKYQFGNRYILDIIPLLYLTLAFGLSRIPLVLQIIIVLYGVTINVVGMYYYVTYIFQ